MERKEMVAELIPFANSKDYEIHISFSDTTMISNPDSSSGLTDIDSYNNCVGE